MNSVYQVLGLPISATKENHCPVFLHHIFICFQKLYNWNHKVCTTLYIFLSKNEIGAYKYFFRGMYILFQMILIDSLWGAVLSSPMSPEGWLWDEDEYTSVKGKLCLIWNSVWTGQLIRSILNQCIKEYIIVCLEN